MKWGWFFVLGLAVQPLAGCALVIGTPGSGVVQSETRPVDVFDEIEVSGAATVHVVFGNDSQVHLTTDDNLLPLIETKVADGKLRIRPLEPIRPSQELVVRITTSDIERIEANGSVNMHIERAKLDALEIELNGACDLVAEGTVDQLTIEASGAADVDTRALQAKSVKFSLSGAGSGQVFASDALSAEISGAGSLRYYGNPTQVNEQLSGVGSIAPGDREDDSPTTVEAEEDDKLLKQLAPETPRRR